ncbi:hypothetical protein M409DRAFT_64089 [Zasmidium cellare ATCC 36951]|uniref:Zn(2)-C6 fungal-type domain-containing protein n=1 Tax=Zasmidium cellare ATCC 36951 TaxID=1080233 RepID=A0A6A6CWR8_ZASCE|nr:uncharacterized protein M409DRAFT_64089 [Zasmidium cellare ATCC 36951]KAF2171153.1 hypothetical protein M409DRAFT_64089 [Zasmidium cellare ATCC 36951]
MTDGTAPAEKRRRIDRVSAACDLCKARKVKCDGTHPCSYCQRKNRADTCTFSGPKPRQTQSTANTPANALTSSAGGLDPPTGRQRQRSDPTSLRQRLQGDEEVGQIGASLSPTVSREDHHEDTDVPLEARLLRDAQGKVIFIGDCAPLSFLQTVRHLLASEIDSDELPLQASRDSIIEAAQPPSSGRAHHGVSVVVPGEVATISNEYFVATSGLVDLFDRTQLVKDMASWASDIDPHTADTQFAVYQLVSAIGLQETDEPRAESYFARARDALLANLCGIMNVAAVQGFTLMSLYMLRAFQPNGAYLYFSLAARTSYAIGLHRTEVNASTGPAMHTMRDRIWKSLRVVDMLISNMLGRPPSTSDVDCTVKYRLPDASSRSPPNILDASVQMFMIIERIVVEVYSRKRISIRIANFVSHQLKGWASNWIRPFTDIVKKSGQANASRENVIGACQTLCTYYYGIMLLTRPFLIYELYEYLGASMRGPSTRAENLEKRKFADAALDASVAFVDTLQSVIASGKMPLRMPLVVSWLFTTSLVLAVGTLGRTGLSFEGTCRSSIQCLDYFSKVDPHARQYSVIVQSLLKTATEHVRKRELHQRSQRKQASSQLFGLLPLESEDTILSDAPSDWTFYDADFFALPWTNENDQGLQDFLQPGRQTLDGALADIPLFPLYDQSTRSFGPYSGQGS